MIRLLAFAFAFVAAAASAANAPFLWKVKGPRATHYLMGSVHLLPPDAYPLPAALDEAYAGTRVIVLETDPAALESPDLQGQMLGRGMSPAGLRAEVRPALYERVRRQAAAMGVPQDLCDGFKPWLCALSLGVMSYQREGMDPSLGLDLHYYHRALKDGRAIRWFETPAQQIEVFGGMSAPMSEQFLASTLDDLTDDRMSATELVKAWREDDVGTIESTVREMKDGFPGAYARMVSDRNRNWMPMLVKTIDGETPALVVTGAAHLVGPDGLVELLRRRGYEVTAAPMRSAPATSGASSR